MSEKRLVRLYIGGKLDRAVAQRLAGAIDRFDPPLLDGYWEKWDNVSVEALLSYARENKWIEIKDEDAIDGNIRCGNTLLTDWLQEERIPYDEQMPPFGELPGIVAYYRPPDIRVSRNCDFFGNPIVEWEEVRKVMTWLQENRAYKNARNMLRNILGPDIEELPFFEVCS